MGSSLVVGASTGATDAVGAAGGAPGAVGATTGVEGEPVWTNGAASGACSGAVVMRKIFDILTTRKERSAHTHCPCQSCPVHIIALTFLQYTTGSAHANII